MPYYCGGKLTLPASDTVQPELVVDLLALFIPASKSHPIAGSAVVDMATGNWLVNLGNYYRGSVIPMVRYNLKPWTANTAVTPGDVVYPYSLLDADVGVDRVMVCTAAGTTGASIATLPALDATVTDGTATFTIMPMKGITLLDERCAVNY